MRKCHSNIWRNSFVLCNNGYTIERFIHGFEDEYNDVNNWKYNGLIDVFNGSEKGARTFTVKTKGEAEKLLTDAEFNAAKVLQFVELHMPWDDAPPALVMTADASAKVNAKTE